MCVRSEMMEALRDKERRAQQRVDRCAEERGRKMEEQRRREQRRRAAAEEKRRQQREAEKVRGQTHASDAFAARQRTRENLRQLCEILKCK